MGLRMRKSFSICKGVKVNFGKTGASLSLGGKGMRHTIHSSGRRTSSIGIPGTGISYVASSNRTKKNRNAQAQLQKQVNETQQNATIVEEYENLIHAIKSIHTVCDEQIDWNHINFLNEPFNPAGMGPKEAEARQRLESFEPNLLGKIFKSMSENKRTVLAQAVEKAALEDRNDYEEWEKLHILSQRILNGDIDAYFEVINEMNPLDDLLEYGSDFEFGADNSTAMEVEFRVKSEQVVPDFAITLTKTGKLSKKALSKTAYYELVQDYVCSCAIRIARDMFALLPLQTVVVHAVDRALNTQTGHQEEATILSIVFEREILTKLNFSAIDPSDAMNNFRYNMRFMKTAGFKPVERLLDY